MVAYRVAPSFEVDGVSFFWQAARVKAAARSIDILFIVVILFEWWEIPDQVGNDAVKGRE
jgi:hypothetical protein